MNEDSGTRTKYAVRTTWPDGHVEVDHCHDREFMEFSAGVAERRRERGESEALPERVQRVVTTGDWTSIPELMAGLLPPSMGGIDGMDGARIQWGVRRTWPDSHVEVRSAYDRFDAETTTEEAEEKRAAGKTEVVAEAVGRLILTSEWEPVPVPAPAASVIGYDDLLVDPLRVVTITRDDLVHPFQPRSDDPTRCGYDYGDEGLCPDGPDTHFPAETAVAVLTEAEVGVFVFVRVGVDQRPVPALSPFTTETLADAAGRVLAEMGWTVNGEWKQTFGGLTGATYEAPVSKR